MRVYVLDYALILSIYAILIFFYSKLIDKKIQITSFLKYVMIVSVIQFFFDKSISLASYKSVFDTIVVIVVLCIWGGQRNVDYFLHAIEVASIYLISMLVIMIASSYMHIDTHILFNVGEQNRDFSVLFKFILIFILIILSIIILDYFTIKKYYSMVKQHVELEFQEKSKEMTFAHIENLQKEYSEIREIKHDMNNQILVMEELLANKRYDELQALFCKVTGELKSMNRSTISGNLYIDALLNQKMNQYKNIRFDLHVKAKEHIKCIEYRDLISLLSNIIDNACEEVERIHGDSFKLDMMIDNDILKIIEINPCRKNNSLTTDKIGKEHGYGLKIIREIVEKYNGMLDIDTKEEFRMEISILF